MAGDRRRSGSTGVGLTRGDGSDSAFTQRGDNVMRSGSQETLCNEGRVDPIRHRLRRQWTIRRQGDTFTLPGWKEVRLNDQYSLFHHCDARIQHIESVFGYSYTWIGCPFHGDHPESTPETWCNGPGARDIPSMLSLINGTYVLITSSDSSVCVYTDPAAMMTAYYGSGCVASSPTLLPNLQRDAATDKDFLFDAVDDWYPGAFTPFAGVRALLANHCLTLPEERIVRFWPLRTPPSVSTREGIFEMSRILKNCIRSVALMGAPLFSLTGGRDSRVNLAAAREHINGVRFFTISSSGVKRADLRIAQELANRFGLLYEVVAYRAAPPWLTDLYDEMTAGLSLGTRRSVIGACAELAGRNHIHVNGNLGALAKAFFWNSRAPHTVTTKSLAKQFRQKTPFVFGALEDWHRTVPDLPAHVVYNLMYLEQRGGRWMAPGEMASSLFYDTVSPFCSRRIFEILSGMPLAYQRNGKALEEIVRFLWPELLSVPYCSGTRPIARMIPKPIKASLRAVLERMKETKRRV